MKFCPKCDYKLYMSVGDGTTMDLYCKNCGHTEQEAEGGLIVETNLQESTGEGYKILVNEFTRQDPTLPHVKNIKCPTATCPTNTSGQERDVILIKYDNKNMKYIYICNVCGGEWRSRS
jgi:DNA-directed RNA polymerase subunit M/transcription elongation factor TFIIS